MSLPAQQPPLTTDQPARLTRSTSMPLPSRPRLSFLRTRAQSVPEGLQKLKDLAEVKQKITTQAHDQLKSLAAKFNEVEQKLENLEKKIEGKSPRQLSPELRAEHEALCEEKNKIENEMRAVLSSVSDPLNKTDKAYDLGSSKAVQRAHYFKESAKQLGSDVLWCVPRRVASVLTLAIGLPVLAGTALFYGCAKAGATIFKSDLNPELEAATQKLLSRTGKLMGVAIFHALTAELRVVGSLAQVLVDPATNRKDVTKFQGWVLGLALVPPALIITGAGNKTVTSDPKFESFSKNILGLFHEGRTPGQVAKAVQDWGKNSTAVNVIKDTEVEVDPLNKGLQMKETAGGRHPSISAMANAAKKHTTAVQEFAFKFKTEVPKLPQTIANKVSEISQNVMKKFTPTFLAP